MVKFEFDAELNWIKLELDNIMLSQVISVRR